MNKVSIAEKLVASRVKRSTSNHKDNLKSLKEALKDISTANDYPRVGWPQLPDLPGNGRSITIKLRASVTEDKTRNFEDTQRKSKRNQSRIFELREALNKSTFSVSSSRKVGVQSQEIADALSAMTNVDNAFTTYNTKLETAIESSSKMVPWPPCGEFSN